MVYPLHGNQPVSSVHSFIEDSTWDRNDERRPARGTVVFQLRMLAQHDAEFKSDFGLFYDPDDSSIIEVLTSNFSENDWNGYVYWKDQADASIKLIDPINEIVVGWITVRRGLNSDLSGQVDWTNVVSMIRK
jgi:hypothetical protein